MCCNAAFGVDITNITNPGNYQQKTRTQKYTVGSDGVSLMYRNRDTGRYRYDEQQDKGIRYSVAMVYGWSTG